MTLRSSAMAVVVLVLAFTLPANALVEARLGLGYHLVNPSEINGGQAGAPKIENLGAFGLDVIVSPPLFPVGLGLRWETLSETAESGAGKVRSSNERLALLINKRLLDTFIWAGAIGTVGLSHKSAIEQNLPPALAVRYETDDATSFTVGAEAGMNFTGLIIGGELGYQHMIARNYAYAGVPLYNSSGRSAKVDYSGLYAKLHVGYGF